MRFREPTKKLIRDHLRTGKRRYRPVPPSPPGELERRFSDEKINNITEDNEFLWPSNILIGCDGSLKDGKAGYGLVVVNGDNPSTADYNNPLYEEFARTTVHQSCYHAEAIAMYRALKIVKITQQKQQSHPDLKSSLTIVSDQLPIVNIVKQMSKKKYSLKESQTARTILSQIEKIVDDIDFDRCTVVHQKSHTEDDGSPLSGNPNVAVNFLADQLAKRSTYLDKKHCWKQFGTESADAMFIINIKKHNENEYTPIEKKTSSAIRKNYRKRYRNNILKYEEDLERNLPETKKYKNLRNVRSNRFLRKASKSSSSFLRKTTLRNEPTLHRHKLYIDQRIKQLEKQIRDFDHKNRVETMYDFIEMPPTHVVKESERELLRILHKMKNSKNIFCLDELNLSSNIEPNDPRISHIGEDTAISRFFAKRLKGFKISKLNKLITSLLNRKLITKRNSEKLSILLKMKILTRSKTNFDFVLGSRSKATNTHISSLFKDTAPKNINELIQLSFLDLANETFKESNRILHEEILIKPIHSDLKEIYEKYIDEKSHYKKRNLPP